jgi:uncharacterized protein
VIKAASLQRWRGRVAKLLQHGLIALVQGYRLFFKAWLGNRCRFEPSCSAYALQALRQHGAAAGAVLTTRRLLRCHPGCEGGHDPVPARCAMQELKDRRDLVTETEITQGAHGPLFRKNP